MNTGKCPGCGKILNAVNVEPIKINQTAHEPRKGASFCCPHCHVILSVEIDPLALAESLLAEIRAKKG